MPTIDEEVEALGLFAAMCDVYACYKHITSRERDQLYSRAERYRNLQLAALSEMNLAERICK